MTNRIDATLTRLRAESRKAMIPYMTPDFPVKGNTVPVLRALEEGGADIIEIGIPFSDPLADGPVIQHSSMVAIEHGSSIVRILGDVREFRTSSAVPVVLMGYTNPIVHYGTGKFFSDCGAAGVDGLIVPDLPPGESDEFRTAAAAAGIAVIFLIAPTSTPERIRLIDGLTTGYSYCVSITGVTGSRHDLGSDASFAGFLATVRTNTTKPFVVGFGIKTKDDVRAVWQSADGAVVGTALINALQDCPTAEACAIRAREFIRSLIPEPTLRKEGSPS